MKKYDKNFSLEPSVIQEAAKRLLSYDITQRQAEQLACFANHLIKWNDVFNLTSITKPDDVLVKHIVDSLSMCQVFPTLVSDKVGNILDVGSGGGLPAIPMAIMYPQMSVVMIDAVQKKTVFLRQVALTCGLNNVEVIHARVQDVKERQFDVVTSRAFASLKDMCTWTEHLLSPNGCWIAMKALDPIDEIAQLPEYIQVLENIPIHIGQEHMERRVLRLCKADITN